MHISIFVYCQVLAQRTFTLYIKILISIFLGFLFRMVLQYPIVEVSLVLLVLVFHVGHKERLMRELYLVMTLLHKPISK